MDTKPNTTDHMDARSFDRWYWDKRELLEICVNLGLPKTGAKDALRARILTFLETGNVVQPKRPVNNKGHFNWARTELSLDTVITDNVSFGPNFRRFMTTQIGKSFSCHSDFMAWVRDNTGKTLSDAVAAWRSLEERKNDPQFRRDIAPHNNYLQYLRDFKDANPQRSLEDAKSAWEIRKRKPIDGERIVYRDEDAL